MRISNLLVFLFLFFLGSAVFSSGLVVVDGSNDFFGDCSDDLCLSSSKDNLVVVDGDLVVDEVFNQSFPQSGFFEFSVGRDDSSELINWKNFSIEYELPEIGIINDCFDSSLDPIPICTLNDLNMIHEYVDYPAIIYDKNFVLMNDIDAYETRYWNWSDSAEIYKGWLPFHWRGGSFDGNHHVIKNLYINRSNESNVGFFGTLKNNHSNNPRIKIKNFGLVDVNIQGLFSVGAVAGLIRGWKSGLPHIDDDKKLILSEIYSTGSVNGAGAVGGFIGQGVKFKIENSYSLVNVKLRSSSVPEKSIGGFAGILDQSVFIKNSYSAGNIFSNIPTFNCCNALTCGGFVGSTWAYNQQKSCFWDIETSNTTKSAGNALYGEDYIAKGKKTLQMTYDYNDEDIFEESGWDFDNVWFHDVNININQGYPYLKSNLSYLTEKEYKPAINVDLNFSNGEIKEFSFSDVVSMSSFVDEFDINSDRVDVTVELVSVLSGHSPRVRGVYFSYEVVDGPVDFPPVCGDSHGGSFSDKPSEDLCSVGDESLVNQEDDEWVWVCSKDGFDDASCSAYFVDEDDPVGPVCGVASGGSFVNAPSGRLCEEGDASDVSEDGDEWVWRCSKDDDYVFCSAHKSIPGERVNSILFFDVSYDGGGFVC